MSEQENSTMEEASEQSLAESVSELETLTQQALEMDGEAREELVEQIKSKCEEEGLSSEEAEALLEEIGLVQEAKKIEEAKAKVKEEDDEEESDDDDDDEDDEEMDEKASAKKESKKVTKEEVEVQLPKTKAAAIFKFQEKLNKLKAGDIMDNYDSIMKALDLKEESETEATEKVDVQDDVSALVEGEELSEEFKEKASTIFEAAVQAKVNEVLNQRQVELEEKNEEVIAEQVAQHKTEMIDQVNNYLEYVAEEWMKENQLAVEKGIRTEITEGFISGLKNLFEEHYITIPEDKVDVVDDLFGKIEDLEKELNEQIQKGVEMNNELSKFKREKVLQSITSGLSDTQAEKVADLAEGVEDEDVETFEKKVEVIKENYFPTKEAKTEVDEVDNSNESQELTENTDPVMSKYASALSRHVR